MHNLITPSILLYWPVFFHLPNKLHNKELKEIISTTAIFTFLEPLKKWFPNFSGYHPPCCLPSHTPSAPKNLFSLVFFFWCTLSLPFSFHTPLPFSDLPTACMWAIKLNLGITAPRPWKDFHGLTEPLIPFTNLSSVHCRRVCFF